MKDIKITKLLTTRTEILERYFAEISRYPVLSPEEEAIVAKKAREGDKAARNKLIRSNLRFVVSVAKKYQELGTSLEDLINDGNIGLMKAAEKFDETKGFKFISFAVWWIRQNITTGLSERKRLVRIPGNILTGYSKITRATIELEQELQRMPNIEEIAVYTQLSEEKVSDYLNSSSTSVSLDKPWSEDESNTLLDEIPNIHSEAPDQQAEQNSLSIELSRLMKKLSNREQQIIRLFYGIDTPFPMTLDDIAKRLNISSERVRQLKSRSMDLLKERAHEELKAYL